MAIRPETRLRVFPTRAAAEAAVSPNPHHPLFIVSKPTGADLYVYAADEDGALTYAADFDGYCPIQTPPKHYTVAAPDGRKFPPMRVNRSYPAVAAAATADGYKARRL
jgi:hypothetical protein